MSVLSEIAGSAATPRQPAQPAREAIVADLERLCAVRRGSMLLAPDFGVDDVTFLFHSFPGGLDPWISRFEETVGKYEPRLRDVRVVRVASGSLELMLRIEIHATLVAASRNSPATFAATIDPHSRLTVR